MPQLDSLVAMPTLELPMREPAKKAAKLTKTADAPGASAAAGPVQTVSNLDKDVVALLYSAVRDLLRPIQKAMACIFNVF